MMTLLNTFLNQISKPFVYIAYTEIFDLPSHVR